MFLLLLRDLSSNNKTSRITAADFFHVCFCSVSTLNHFCHGRSSETPSFHPPADVVPFWGEHSGVASPGCLSTQTFSPFTAAKFLLSLQAFPLTVPCYSLHTFTLILNTHLFKHSSTCKPGWLVYILLYSSDHFSGYFSHSDFFCLHVSRSTFKLPCSAIHALCES